MSTHGTPDGLVLSPSGAGRWTQCPASAVLSRGLPDSSSVFAEAGTAGHALASALWEDRTVDAVRVLEEFDRHPQWPASGLETLTAVHRWMTAVQELCPDDGRWAEQHSELPLTGDYFWPGFHGTADFAGVFEHPGGRCHVVSDLKLGKGVPVAAEGNLQLAVYAHMWLHDLGVGPDAELILQIGQTLRSGGVSQWRLSAGELEGFIDAYVRPALDELAWLVDHGRAYGRPGSWCRFCPAKAVCCALADESLRLSGEAPGVMTGRRLGEALDRLPEVKAWVAGVEDAARDRIASGGGVDGWTLKPGTTRRVVVDEATAVERLLEHGCGRDEIGVFRLKSLRDLTKAVGDGNIDDVLGASVEVRQNKARLVKETDRVTELFRKDDN